MVNKRKRQRKSQSLSCRPSEHHEQVALFQWADFQRARWPELALMYANANGGNRNAVTGALLKAEGVKAGVLDITLPVARGGYHGLYIEMKTLTGRTSKEQQWWVSRLLEQGYLAVVCKGCQPAMQVISNYLSGRPDAVMEVKRERQPIIRQQHYKRTRVHQSR